MEAKERTRDRGQLRVVGLIHYLNVVFKELPALLVHLCLCLERGIGAGMLDAAQGTQQEWQGGGGGTKQTKESNKHAEGGLRHVSTWEAGRSLRAFRITSSRSLEKSTATSRAAEPCCSRASWADAGALEI